jgi:16S rRNA (adenine1518-N6/adenine1519-N6)-dimethyltransferase
MTNLTDVDFLKNYLHSHGFRPKDYMGQNFLVDEEVLAVIIQAANLRPTDVVVEVGPGLGVLTNELVQRAGKVVAVEKDKRLFEILSNTFGVSVASKGVARSSPLLFRGGVGEEQKESANSSSSSPSLSSKGGEAKLQSDIHLFNQDILRFNLSEHVSGPYKVVANIPYYLTSKLFQYFLNQELKPELLVLMVQKEVGERVVAGPGELSILGISVQIFADAEIVAQVSKNSFWPVPKVDSVILKITPKIKCPEIKDEKLFFRIIKTAFAGKRKQIHNTLTHGLQLPKEKVLEILTQAKIDPISRPQDLAIEDWIRLYKLIFSQL